MAPSQKETPMAIHTTKTKRIIVRRSADGYRITGHRATFASHGAAFDAAWNACRRQHADLYARTPEGRCILSLSAQAIREYEQST
jgi:hypothetical protein